MRPVVDYAKLLCCFVARDLTDEQRKLVHIMLLALSNFLIHGGNTNSESLSDLNFYRLK